MDQKDAQRIPGEKTPTGTRTLEGVFNRFRIYGLQNKLILPYLLLTILLAVIGTFIVIRLVATDKEDRINNQLYTSSGSAADAIRQLENTNLKNLRYLVATKNLPQMLEQHDKAALSQLVFGLSSSFTMDFVSMIDRGGLAITSLVRNADKTYVESSKEYNFNNFDAVKKLLSPENTVGDKHVGIFNTDDQSVLVTGRAVPNEKGEITGVVLVGTNISTLMETITKQALTSQVILLDEQYNLLATTFPTTSGADATSTQSSSGNVGQTENDSLEGHLKDFQTQPLLEEDKTGANFRKFAVTGRKYRFYYAPFNIRDEVKGWVGMGFSDDYQAAPITYSRNWLVFLFSIGTAAVIVIGYFLAQSIARPILKLRDLSQEVAAGDFNQAIGLQRSDEIGELAKAFDQMTLQLRERTEEAARLFELTLQRNRELDYINARLQSMQIQLIQAEKLAAVGQLTAGIVHDVKNPLAVIKGLSEVLLGNELTPEERQNLNVIHESSVKANTIVTDLLKFARQSTPEKKFQDLRETVDASLRLTAYLSRKASIDVIKDLPERPIMMWYDSQQLEQVFINIITNAIQSMPEKGILRVSVRRVDSTVALGFQDNGVGIPPENLKRIFDPFFTTKPEGQGTGLGLSVSYGIVTNHNGQIQVESKVGEGSTFTIVLPVDQSMPPQGVL